MVLGAFILLLSFDILNIVYDNIKYTGYYDKTKNWSENSENRKKFKKDYPVLSKLYTKSLVPRIGIWLPFTGRCITQKQINYFKCNKLQIFLSRTIYENIKED